YYIYKATHEIDHHIFLLFDLFLPYKETLYTSFRDNIGKNALVDIYFHHYDKDHYQKLIRGAIGHYTDYIIMPVAGEGELIDWFDEMFKNENIYILDLGLEQYGKKYPSVCQNFKKQWYEGLAEAEDKIRKYNQLVLKHKAVWSHAIQPHDREMIVGFRNFCRDKNIDSKIIDKEEELGIRKSECYFLTDDCDLVSVVKKARQKKLTIGEDIGLISHNDTPLKSICCHNGVATISTDFEAMGKKIADMINNGGQKEHIENPSGLILRDSI
ncbi:MAG: substrate-binding domain-containing protein, partial [Candidatus Marinimicrobia bacterium]|nr:substrate-binding domain-containing protein [Candidatus Neomarinimicrobiota bacterium]